MIQGLAAVGTGIGVLGFVTAFGGGVVYTRMEKAGVPPGEAVAATPRESLIAIGATFLLPAVAIALAAVLLLFLYVAVAEWVHQRRLGLTEREKKSQLEAAQKAEDQAIDQEQTASSASRKAERAWDSLRNADLFDEETAGRMRETARAHADEAARSGDRAAELRAEAEAARKRAAAVDANTETMARAQRGTRLMWATVLLLAVEMLAITLLFAGPEGAQWWLVSAAAAVGAAAAGAIYARSDSFLRFAIAAFLAIGVVIGIADYDRLRNDPEVEPAAALRKDGISLAGYFVAETDSRIYLGRPEDSSRIIEIPRDNLAILTVGPLMNREPAMEEARALATALCEDHREAKQNSGTPSAAPRAASTAKGKKAQKAQKAREKAVRCTVR